MKGAGEWEEIDIDSPKRKLGNLDAALSFVGSLLFCLR